MPLFRQSTLIAEWLLGSHSGAAKGAADSMRVALYLKESVERHTH
jgi:hypothetical protein